jgi:hypothetical protein
VGACTTCGLVSASISGGRGVITGGVTTGGGMGSACGLVSRSVCVAGGTGRSAVFGAPRSASVGSRLGDAAAL